MTNNPPKVCIDKATDYKNLIGESEWNRLHPDIKKRFSAKNYHQAITYQGIMQDIYLSKSGSILAHLCRLIGTPLALYNGRDIPITVDVYPNEKLRGMTWDRFYHYPNRKTNRITSTKCITDKNQLIEVVGSGFGMNLKLYEKNQALVFESTQFFIQIGKFRLRLPDLLSPGKTTVTQTALPNHKFRFSLVVRHKLLGLVYFQSGTFAEAVTGSNGD